MPEKLPTVKQGQVVKAEHFNAIKEALEELKTRASIKAGRGLRVRNLGKQSTLIELTAERNPKHKQTLPFAPRSLKTENGSTVAILEPGFIVRLLVVDLIVPKVNGEDINADPLPELSLAGNTSFNYLEVIVNDQNQPISASVISSSSEITENAPGKVNILLFETVENSDGQIVAKLKHTGNVHWMEALPNYRPFQITEDIEASGSVIVQKGIVRELVNDPDTTGTIEMNSIVPTIGGSPLTSKPSLGVSNGQKVFLRIATDKFGKIKALGGGKDCTILAGSNIPDNILHSEEQEREGLYHYDLGTVTVDSEGRASATQDWNSDIDFYVKEGFFLEDAPSITPSYNENLSPQEAGIKIDRGIVKEFGATGVLTVQDCQGQNTFQIVVKDGRIIRMNITQEVLEYGNACETNPSPP